MTQMSATRIPNLIRKHESQILAEWIALQLQSAGMRRDLINDDDVRRHSKEFLATFVRAAEADGIEDVRSASWAPVRELISRVSQVWARLGFSPSETAMFVFSLKQPLFSLLRQEEKDPELLASETWAATLALDSLGLVTMEAYQKAREEVIGRQQQEMLELSTPVVTLWDGVLALPLIGTLDSARTQVVMENLLQRIVDSGASIAIIDITGVPTVDTVTAQHLLKTVAAARLMGADCIISGIRPQIAQTIVHLGVDLSSVVTKATLADAFRVALQRSKLTVTRVETS